MQDNSADRFFEIGSFLILSEVSGFEALKEGDKIITKLSAEKEIKYEAHVLHSSPYDDEWILYHMSNNDTNHKLYTISKKDKPSNVEIVYKIEGSFLT